jgi:hypothetical protein
MAKIAVKDAWPRCGRMVDTILPSRMAMNGLGGSAIGELVRVWNGGAH